MFEKLKQFKKQFKNMSKISEQELQNLQQRHLTVEQKNFELSLFRNEMREYIQILLGKYEKDPQKLWKISLGDGSIEEEKPIENKEVAK